jgi:HSP20 family protein
MTALVRWQPYRETVSLSDVMDRMLSRSFFRPYDWATSFWGATQAMPVDITENANGFTVKASVPGVKPEELDINVENNMLTIRAQRKSEDSNDELRWQERYYGKLERCFTLPTDVDVNNVKAELEHGVLTLSLPKAETAKPKSIKVEAK